MGIDERPRGKGFVLAGYSGGVFRIRYSVDGELKYSLLSELLVARNFASTIYRGCIMKRDYNCDSCGVPDKICDPHNDCVADVWHAALKSVDRRKTVRGKRPVQQPQQAVCHWKSDEYEMEGYFETDCGRTYQVTGGMDLVFCPYCSKRLAVQ